MSYAYSFLPSWTSQPAQVPEEDDDEDFFDATDDVQKV